MLVIISDLHLGDGTCGKAISHTAFRLFTSRLQELAYTASWRDDGKYRPIKELTFLWLGDILDPLHSTSWLDTNLGDPDYVRPWTDSSSPLYIKKVRDITRAILRNNRRAVDAIHNITQERSILIPPAIANGQPDPTSTEKVKVDVRLYYMVGNHDWVYHLKGQEYNDIRQEIIDAFGLSNKNTCFPHEIEEVPELKALLDEYKVYARHGDVFDNFNYDKNKGRKFSSFGDIFSVEIINRYPVEVRKQLGNELPIEMLNNLGELTNVRPALGAGLWVGSQTAIHGLSKGTHNKLKRIWDQIGEEFLALDAVRQNNKRFKFDYYDTLYWGFKLSKMTSLDAMDNLTAWLHRRSWTGELTMAENALKEKAFLDKSANYVVYGHAHRHEIIPLDLISKNGSKHGSQIYINSGTWHTYYDLALHKPKSKRFIPYQVLTYLVFYKDDQREGRRFETWSGAYS